MQALRGLDYASQTGCHVPQPAAVGPVVVAPANGFAGHHQDLGDTAIRRQTAQLPARFIEEPARPPIASILGDMAADSARPPALRAAFLHLLSDCTNNAQHYATSEKTRLIRQCIADLNGPAAATARRDRMIYITFCLKQILSGPVEQENDILAILQRHIVDVRGVNAATANAHALLLRHSIELHTVGKITFSQRHLARILRESQELTELPKLDLDQRARLLNSALSLVEVNPLVLAHRAGRSLLVDGVATALSAPVPAQYPGGALVAYRQRRSLAIRALDTYRLRSLQSPCPMADRLAGVILRERVASLPPRPARGQDVQEEARFTQRVLENCANRIMLPEPADYRRLISHAIDAAYNESVAEATRRDLVTALSVVANQADQMSEDHFAQVVMDPLQRSDVNELHHFAAGGFVFTADRYPALFALNGCSLEPLTTAEGAAAGGLGEHALN